MNFVASRLKGGVSTGLRSRDVSGRKRKGAQANQVEFYKTASFVLASTNVILFFNVRQINKLSKHL